MAKIPVTNTTAMPIYVGASMIPPGETRHFEESDVPVHLRPAPTPSEPAAPPEDAIAKLASANAKDIIAAVPGLQTDELERLGELEQARMIKDKPASRETVLAAISEEMLRRADDPENQDKQG